MAYAKGTHAWGISDRSGFRYKLREMKKEWNGLLVGPDEYEEKHPQLDPPRVPIDPQALKNARPDQGETLKVYVATPTVMEPDPKLTRAIGKVGSVEVTIS